MIITQEKTQVTSSHNFESVNCTIDAEDMRYVASLLRNNYSNTRLAVVREISANAIDANREANSTCQIEIKVPTSLSPTFAVRDFGGGLSEEDVFGLYSKYGKSTKRESNNYIGAFGIGKFAPLSYGENFTCVSYHGGLKTSYNVFVNDDDDTKISKLFSEPTNEPTGLSIEVAVAESDISEFRNVVQDFFRFFPQKDMPKFLGVEEHFIPEVKKSFGADDDSWFFVEEDRNHYGYGHYHASILMGRVKYKLDANAINVDNFIADEKIRKIVTELISDRNFVFRVPLGSVKLHHSREALEYNKATQKSLCKILFKVAKDIKVIAVEKLSSSTCYFDAKRNYAIVLNSLPYGIRSSFGQAFEWQGYSVNSSTFDRPYDLHDDVIITLSQKNEDKDARNGFKVQSQKTNRVVCQDDTAILIQDLDSSHGNNLRVRTMMNNDSELKNVYIVHPKNGSGWAWFDDECHRDLINEKYLFNSSEVEKEKPNRVASGKGQSRANVPLFKMNFNGYQPYRNADFWEDVKAPLSSLEFDGQSNYKGKNVYVAIKNYKVDSDEFDNEKVLKTTKLIRKNLQADENDPMLDVYGIRSKDVSKLDTDLWISWEDMYVDFAKNHIRSKKNDAKLIVRKNQLDKADVHMDYHWNNFLSNRSLDTSSLGEDHVLNRFLIDYKARNLDNVKHFLNQCVCLVTHKDFNWLENFLNLNVDVDAYENNYKEIEANYPLLKMVASSVSYSSNLTEDRNFGNIMQNVLDYISLCDQNRGEGE
jgi:hypothetical protein